MGKTIIAKKSKKALQPSSIKRGGEVQLDNLFKKAQDKPNTITGQDLENAGSIAEDKRIEIAEMVKELNNNKSLITGLSQSMKDSTEALRGKIKGSIFGIITAEKLKEAFDIQLEEQIKANGPNDILTKTITVVNNNIAITARYLQEILKIQVITIARIIKNTQIETKRAKKVANIAERIKKSNVSINELVDVTLELNDYANDLESSLTQIKGELIDDAKKLALTAKSEAIDVADHHMETITASLSDSIATKIESTRKETQEKAENDLAKAKSDLEKAITESHKTAQKLAHGELEQAVSKITNDIESARKKAEDKATNELESANHSLKKRLMGAYVIGGFNLLFAISMLLLIIFDKI